MNIRVKTFAVLKSYFQEEFDLELDYGSNIYDLMEKLELLNPKASHVISHSLVAMNDEMVDKSIKLKGGELVCILPPVSGG
ncbi:MAG: MoaD/ThiS family protein [Leptospiraceae bacterium]|nr:MoaD/ThiS family protein [Leptospiraceae bacterium]